MQKDRSASIDMSQNSATSRIVSYAAVFTRRFQFALSLGLIMRFASRGPSESLLWRISEETEICIGRENARRLKLICGERGSVFFEVILV